MRKVSRDYEGEGRDDWKILMLLFQKTWTWWFSDQRRGIWEKQEGFGWRLWIG